MTTINDTHTASGLGGSLLSPIANAVQSISALIKARRQLRQLEELDDHTLYDIGLCRSDLHCPDGMPKPLDPMTLLIKISRAS
jgi:hypothetical protein